MPKLLANNNIVIDKASVLLFGFGQPGNKWIVSVNNPGPFQWFEELPGISALYCTASDDYNKSRITLWLLLKFSLTRLDHFIHTANFCAFCHFFYSQLSKPFLYLLISISFKLAHKIIHFGGII